MRVAKSQTDQKEMCIMTDDASTELLSDNAGKSDISEEYKRVPVTYIAIAVLLFWTFLLGITLYWNIDNIRREEIAMATAEARANWNKDQVFRAWASKHGGFYVTPDSRTPPSPYLAHLPDRDVVTREGKKLTLMNPAYMMRQMTEEFEQTYGIKGRITAKVLLNPNNAPDEWERKALDQFDKGVKEIIELADIDGESYVRLMKPMVMEKSCEKCHGHLGFKVGDIRGGISVSVPLKPYMAIVSATSKSLILDHSVVWLLGLAGIIVFSVSARKREAERLEFQRERTENYRILMQRFEVRTEELRESEKRFKRSHDFANIGTWYWVVKTGEINWSEHISPMFGYEAGMLETTFENFLNTIHTDDEKMVTDALNDCLENNSEYDIEYRIVWPNGEIHWLHAQGDVGRDDKGTALNMLGIVNDVTKRKQAEDDLRVAKQLSDEANKAKSEFLSSMSHELRTPLNAILGFGELLGYFPDQPLSEQQQNCVNHIKHGGEHLLDLINEVLDLAKIEAGKMELSLETLQAQEIVSECTDLVQTLAEGRRIQLINKYCGTESASISVDYKRIKQILLNLLSNAIKYNREGGTITIDGRELPGGRLHIDVTDTGFGISKDNIDKLFTPFNRLGAETSDIAGTGIGLSLSKKLIEMMKGEIGLDSTVGKGTTFWIELPVIIDEARLEEVTEETQRSSIFPDIPGTLLYVEDNLTNQRLMETIVNNISGLDLIVESTAEQGIKKACELQPDLIILDIN